MKPKLPSRDLHRYHFILKEFGIICSLLICIAAFKIELPSNAPNTDLKATTPDDAIVIDVPITVQKNQVKPLKPMLFVEAPTDEIIEDPILEFPDFDAPSALPMLPPDEEVEEDDFVLFLPIMPEIKGGQQELYSKIKYPKQAQRAGIEGRVIVQFIVDEEGRVTKPQIIRGLGHGLDEEVLRVLQLIRFKPGIQNGKFVKVKMTQAVKFTLE